MLARIASSRWGVLARAVAFIGCGALAACGAGAGGDSVHGSGQGDAGASQGNGSSTNHSGTDAGVAHSSCGSDSLDLAGCTCQPGQAPHQCFSGDAHQAGVGACHWGTQTCTDSGEFGTWSACSGAGSASASEICGDGVDNDCDGVVDQGCQSDSAVQSDAGEGHDAQVPVVGAETDAQVPVTGGTGCATAANVTPMPVVQETVMGNTCDGQDMVTLSCNLGPALALYYVIDRPAGLSDYVLSITDGFVVATADNADRCASGGACMQAGGSQKITTVPEGNGSPPAGQIYLIVEKQNGCGPFTLTILRAA